MSSGHEAAARQTGWRRWKMATIEPGSRQPAGSLATVGEIEMLQDQARKEGRKEGYSEGYAQGMSAAQGQVARIRTIVESLDTAFTSLQHEIADDVLTLALDVARQVLQEALPVKKELLLPVVRKAIQGMASGNARVQLNPADVDLVRAHFGEELRVNGWQIVEDHRIQPGGCRITSPTCEVDATVANRWNRVLATLGKDHAWLAGQ